MFRRIVLFVLTNIAIITVLVIVLRLFGLDGFLGRDHIHLGALATFAAVLGFGGAFISLGISRMMAKWAMGVKVIDPRVPPVGDEGWVLHTTHRLCQEAGLKTMPEVGIYDNEEVNAFATGPTKARSLVAVSTGLLNKLSKDEVEGVLAHEVAHIKNGDMVTMTLLQGVINTFVIFLSRVIAWGVSQLVREELGWIVYYIVSFVLQILMSILGMMVVMAYSRHREFRADAGAAALAGKGKMISALERLKSTHELVDTAQPALATMKISGAKGLFKLFSSHPPIEERIAKLQQA